MTDRYIRQETYRDIQEKGQELIRGSKVAVIGLGAIGSRSAELLARAGVGTIRLIDRDITELQNLQRMSLFTEIDAASEKPKAITAAEHLRQINSENTYEPLVEDANSSNIDHLISDVDLVLDGTDNAVSKFLIGEACRHAGKNWIYAMTVGSRTTIKAFCTGEEEPCLRCMMNYDGTKGAPTCVTEGVLGTSSAIAASVQVNEALKILTGSDALIRDMIQIDDWNGRVFTIPLARDPECPVCHYGQYSFYGKATGMQAADMCGKDSVQIVPPRELQIDFESFEKRLSAYGTVRVNAFTMDFDDGKIGIKLFKNGRAIIKHVTEIERAKSLYTKYVENSL